ncbi:MAG: glycosyltransferase family 39 protein [Deltaproteobacteria bacterium]|nr:glycosyltransferase family 39 protein [Deltaproteobacteria bacterium]MBI3066266.1 glycosyltransferase family 39 protein [Deltaproteobacteria bacterium]
MRSRSLLLPLLFALSLAILSPGITSVSIFTDPDEYHRIYRTVLSMMENDEWMAPRLDGIPRVRKPPLTYWMTRLSFELFGVSVTSGRAINVFFAALLVVVVALIGFEYDKDPTYGFNAGLIALSMLGMGISSKFLMHDLSAAALSGLAFYCFLLWSRTGLQFLLLAMAAALTAGFFIKGPVVLVVAGSGVGSLFLTKPAIRRLLWRCKFSLLLPLALSLGLIFAWYAYVSSLYPDQTFAQMDEELSARHLGTLTWRPLASVVWMFLPWTFVIFAALYRVKPADGLSSGNGKWSLAIFCGLSLLPFFFFHFLDRYILGSTIPVALLCALAFKLGDVDRRRLGFRIGMAVSSIVIFLWIGLSWWFRTSIWELALALGAYLFFVIVWLRRPKVIRMAVSASLVWMALTGLLLPTFGSNKVPPRIVERVRDSRVILYRVPEPAFLPLMLKRSLEYKEELRPGDDLNLEGKTALTFVNQRDQKRFEQRAAALGISATLVDSYSSFPSTDGFTGQSRNKTIAGNMTRALRTRSLEPIMDTFLLYELE